MTTMIRKRSRVSAFVAAVALLAGALAYAGFGSAEATHSPADKVVAAGSTLEEVGPGAGVPILEASLKTSTPTDLILSVSLECSIFTQLTTGSLGQTTETANAQGRVIVWVEVDGEIVPVNSDAGSTTGAPAPGTDADKVTFCDREYQRTVTDQEDDGQDLEEDYIRTKAANAFNWLRLNMGNGEHDIVVKADLEIVAGENSSAEAVIGNRSLIVEPTKLANDATV